MIVRVGVVVAEHRERGHQLIDILNAILSRGSGWGDRARAEKDEGREKEGRKWRGEEGDGEIEGGEGKGEKSTK